MGSKKIEAVPKIPARKKYVRSRKKYRKAAWGSLFLQMLLEKLREKELLRAGSASAPQKGEKKAEAAVFESVYGWSQTGLPAPSAGRDTLEISFSAEIIPVQCGNYTAAAKAMQSAGIVSDSRMFRGPFSVMKDYYEGGIQEEALVSSFKDYCGSLIGDGERDEFFRERAQLAITEGYEYYSRANARNAVRQNFKEGRSLVEECGLYIQGMSYYNADYYYLCRNVNGLLKTACAALAEEFGAACPDFGEIERNTRFYREGGITYHGVWEWSNRNGVDSCSDHGLRDGAMEPPEQFIYLYVSGFDQKDAKKAELLVKKLDGLFFPQDRWELFTLAEDDSYHNGLSYLLDESCFCHDKESGRGKAMSFLANFQLYHNSGCLELLHTALE